MSIDIAEFLGARLDEDEAMLRLALDAFGVPESAGLYRDHFSAVRLLRDADADRAIIHALAHPDPLQGPEFSAGLRLAAMYRAAVYSGHPDYQQEWKP